jgi:endonuclease YncB( thermonuclease family)
MRIPILHILRGLQCVSTATRLVGSAAVVDGNTIVVEGESIRLHGIDAPDLGQTFMWRGGKAPCGMMAMSALETLVTKGKVRCDVTGRDRKGQVIARCFAPDGGDIARCLVSAGWALAYRRYSAEYVDAEVQACRAQRGLWRGTFETPWIWREARYAAEQGDANVLLFPVQQG